MLWGDAGGENCGTCGGDACDEAGQANYGCCGDDPGEYTKDNAAYSQTRCCNSNTDVLLCASASLCSCCAAGQQIDAAGNCFTCKALNDPCAGDIYCCGYPNAVCDSGYCIGTATDQCSAFWPTSGGASGGTVPGNIIGDTACCNYSYGTTPVYWTTWETITYYT